MVVLFEIFVEIFFESDFVVIVDDNVEDCFDTGDFWWMLLLFCSEVSLVILFETFVEFFFESDFDVIVDDNVIDCFVTGDFEWIIVRKSHW